MMRTLFATSCLAGIVIAGAHARGLSSDLEVHWLGREGLPENVLGDDERWTLLRRCLRDDAPVGCPACNGTGFRGRTGIFEVLVIDDALRDAIAGGASSATLARLAARGGHRSLAAASAAKLAAGITTREEIERVVGTPALA